MPLFGKSDDKPKLIETVGPVPEGYHSAGIIQEFSSGHFDALTQAKILKALEKKCNILHYDGFSNYRISTHFDVVNSADVIYAYADAIKQN